MNLFSVRDLSTAELLDLSTPPLPASQSERATPQGGFTGILSFLFEQPSLRTMSSFAAAGVRVGLSPIAITTAGNQFRNQTEFEDEVLQLALTSRCVVVRSQGTLNGEAYAHCPVPVVNGGDGNNEHPTQTLIDIAVMRHFGLEGRSAAIMGNMKDHRTAHSLCLALQALKVPVRLISPAGLTMDEAYLGRGEVEIVHAHSEAERNAALADIDFVYLLPTMSLTSPDRLMESVYSLDFRQARRSLKPSAKILHPFPRFGELGKDLDYTSYDAFHMQTSFGPLVREKVLRHLLADTGAATVPIPEPATAEG